MSSLGLRMIGTFRSLENLGGSGQVASPMAKLLKCYTKAAEIDFIYQGFVGSSVSISYFHLMLLVYSTCLLEYSTYPNFVNIN